MRGIRCSLPRPKEGRGTYVRHFAFHSMQAEQTRLWVLPEQVTEIQD
jgi:hypothetical protein